MKSILEPIKKKQKQNIIITNIILEISQGNPNFYLLFDCFNVNQM